MLPANGVLEAGAWAVMRYCYNLLHCNRMCICSTPRAHAFCLYSQDCEIMLYKDICTWQLLLHAKPCSMHCMAGLTLVMITASHCKPALMKLIADTWCDMCRLWGNTMWRWSAFTQLLSTHQWQRVCLSLNAVCSHQTLQKQPCWLSEHHLHVYPKKLPSDWPYQQQSDMACFMPTLFWEDNMSGKWSFCSTVQTVCESERYRWMIVHSHYLDQI